MRFHIHFIRFYFKRKPTVKTEWTQSELQILRYWVKQKKKHRLELLWCEDNKDSSALLLWSNGKTNKITWSENGNMNYNKHTSGCVLKNTCLHLVSTFLKLNALRISGESNIIANAEWTYFQENTDAIADFYF